MRKFDDFVNKNFNGNMEQALEFLLYSSGEEKLDNYVSELTREEALIVFRLMKKEAIKQYGGEKNYSAELDKTRMLMSLNLTEEEVKNAQKNPYKAKLLKNVLKMLIMDGGIILLSLLSVPASALGLVASVGTGLLSMTIASNLIDYVKFNKLKKTLNAQYEKEILDANSKGRGM